MFGMEEALLDDLKSRVECRLFSLTLGPRCREYQIFEIDYLHGIRQAVQHLAALQHEHIAFISGPLTLRSAVARKQAFLQSMGGNRIAS